MSKSYKNVKLKKDRVYNVEQLTAAIPVTANTVSNWVGDGLCPSDAQTPYVFRGAAVNLFLKRMRERMRYKLVPGQFHCRNCQAGVFPRIKTVVDFEASNGKHMYSARCTNCSSKLQKISSETDRDRIEDCRNPNTPTDCLHENNTPEGGEIWISEGKDVSILHFENDRIIFRWQTYAGRYVEKTVDKHLAAIRCFEDFHEGKTFAKLTTTDFAAFRDELKRRAGIDAVDSLSASSIKHLVSHIAAFFNWLLKQDGYRRLPKDFEGYLKLPKAVLAQSAHVKKKEFPSLEQAEELLREMPSKSLVDQRARALFALAFLGALRADTLVSLMIKHIDQERRLILQDGKVVRAKAGKSLNVYWFQIPSVFEEAVLDWIERLHGLGFAGEDALFPDAKNLTHRVRPIGSHGKPVPVMSTTHAVTAAFSTACRNIDTKYTPHAAKHTIGAERDLRPLTREERKAWSLNMGHQSEQVTELHYGTMSEDQRLEVLENIGGDSSEDFLNSFEREVSAQISEFFDNIRMKVRK